MKGPVTEFGYPISIEFSNRNVPRKLAMDQEIAKKAGESLLFRILRKFKRALIIQENFDDTPDDEGSRPAGSITFDFKGLRRRYTVYAARSSPSFLHVGIGLDPLANGSRRHSSMQSQTSSTGARFNRKTTIQVLDSRTIAVIKSVAYIRAPTSE
jgi:hypothetical protein